MPGATSLELGKGFLRNPDWVAVHYQKAVLENRGLHVLNVFYTNMHLPKYYDFDVSRKKNCLESC